MYHGKVIKVLLNANGTASIAREKRALINTVQLKCADSGETSLNIYDVKGTKILCPLVAATTNFIQVEDASGFAVADTVTIARTNATTMNSETKTISAISGNNITFTAPVTYNQALGTAYLLPPVADWKESIEMYETDNDDVKTINPLARVHHLTVVVLTGSKVYAKIYDIFD